MSKPPLSAFDAIMNPKLKPQTPKLPSSLKKRKSSHSTSSQNPSNNKFPKLPSPQAVKLEQVIKPEEVVKSEQRKIHHLSSSNSSNGKTVELNEQVSQLKQKPSSFDPALVIAWEKGQPVPFLFLALAFDMISQASGKVITDIVCNMLLTVMLVTPEDLVPIVYLSANRIAPAHEGLELGMGDSIISKALAEVYGRSKSWIKTQYQKKGDLGLVARESRSSQPMLGKKPAALTIRKVFNTFCLISKESGKDSQGKKKTISRHFLLLQLGVNLNI